MSKKVIVLGAGVTGMSVAAYLALNGFEVEIFEKNDSCGGRASLSPASCPWNTTKLQF